MGAAYQFRFLVNNNARFDQQCLRLGAMAVPSVHAQEAVVVSRGVARRHLVSPAEFSSPKYVRTRLSIAAVDGTDMHPLML